MALKSFLHQTNMTTKRRRKTKEKGRRRKITGGNFQFSTTFHYFFSSFPRVLPMGMRERREGRVRVLLEKLVFRMVKIVINFSPLTDWMLSFSSSYFSNSNQPQKN